MSAIQMIKDLQAQLEAMNAALELSIKNAAKHQKELRAEIDDLNAKINFGVQLANEFEEKECEKQMLDSEALAALYVSGRTDGDFRTFCETTGADLPDKIKAQFASDEESEEEAA